MTAWTPVKTPEEIAAAAGEAVPFLRLPSLRSVFAERAMRLRQLGADHPISDFLRFVGEAAAAQQVALEGVPPMPVPDRAALDRAAAAGLPPLAAADWPRDAAWRGVARALARAVEPAAPAALAPALRALAEAPDEALEAQADALLGGTSVGLDLSTSTVIAAALQVVWVHLVAATQAGAGDAGAPFGRIDDDTQCPCCGAPPVASVTRQAGGADGQRYLVCSLCAAEWHRPRLRCTHCGSDKHLAYHSLAAAGDDGEAAASRAAQAAVQAETCEDCGRYLKILHTARDPMIEPQADDLATLTLDLLMADAGRRRHGVNLMLLFGAPDDPGAPPPDPRAG